MGRNLFWGFGISENHLALFILPSNPKGVIVVIIVLIGAAV